MKFRDIVQFPHCHYRIHVNLKEVKEHLEHWDRPDMGNSLILNPEWQRGHVWTKKQQIAFMEYFLKGGTTGREIYFNCSSWGGEYNTPTYCLDGLQRITAALAFFNNEIKVYEHYYKEFEDSCRIIGSDFHFNVMKVKNKKELLSVYLMFNSGGTPHNPKELKRIQEMIDNTPESDTL